MHRPCISTDKQASAAGERNQLGDGAGDTFGGSAASGFDCMHEFFFAGSVIDERFQSMMREALGHISIAVWRPLLGSPTGAGVEYDKFSDVAIVQLLVALLLGGWIVGEFNLRDSQPTSGHGFREGEILLDDVGSLREYLAGVEHASRVLPGLSHTIESLRAGPARNES